MQVNPHYELCRVPRAQVNEVYLNGSDSPYQREAMENVYYWYDGNVPYCTDANAWQPLDDNFIHMNVPGYSYVDGSHHGAHQIVNLRHSHVGYQESVHSNAPQHWEPSLFVNAHGRTHHHQYSTPPSPCISIADHFASTFSSLIAWNDAVQSPSTQHRRHQQHQHQHQQKHSDDDELPLPSITVPSNYRSPVPTRTASPVHAQEQQHQRQRQPQEHQLPTLEESRASTPPPLSVPPSPAPDSSPLAQEDLVGRRAPKRRRITRAVQPLACYFCRGRKIACGPPTHSRSGDRTCEPCARRHLVCEYPAESYRGRRNSGPKTATPVKVKSQQQR